MGLSPGFASDSNELRRHAPMVLCVLLAIILTVLAAAPASARSGFAAITVDASSGKVIYARNADAPRFPASLTKVMTLYILFEEIDAGRMSFSTRMRVSAKAQAQQPSRLGLRAGQTISAREAMYALITKSANDAAMVIAEHIGGSQKAFAARMTRTARSMGMTRTTFTNPNGLPDSRQVTTARDMATLGLRIQKDFPRYYKYFATRSFKYGKRRYRNHNRLLGQVSGVDGIKTGYTRASRFNLLSSMKSKGRRVVGVVMGAKSGRSRNAFMARILRRDVKKSSRGSRIASVAGSPPGYKATVTAKPKIAAPIPRPRPDRLSTLVAAASTLPEQPQHKPQPRTITQLAVEAVGSRESAGPFVSGKPAPGVTFSRVVVDERARAAHGKSDSLSASTIPATEPVTEEQRMALLARQSAEEGIEKITDRIPAGSPVPHTGSGSGGSDATASTASKHKAEMVIRDPRQVERKLAQHQSSWNIQIGAFPSRERARSQIDLAKSRHGKILRQAVPFLMAIAKDGDVIYRARFSGLNKAQATSACKVLKKSGVGCFPLAPSS